MKKPTKRGLGLALLTVGLAGALAKTTVDAVIPSVTPMGKGRQ